MDDDIKYFLASISPIVAIILFIIVHYNNSIKSQIPPILENIKFSGVRYSIYEVEDFLKIKNKGSNYNILLQSNEILELKVIMLKKINNSAFPCIIFLFRNFIYNKELKRMICPFK